MILVVSFPTCSQHYRLWAGGASVKEVTLAITTCEKRPTYRKARVLNNYRHKAMDAGVPCANFARRRWGRYSPLLGKKKKGFLKRWKKYFGGLFYPIICKNNAYSYSKTWFHAGEAGSWTCHTTVLPSWRAGWVSTAQTEFPRLQSWWSTPARASHSD